MITFVTALYDINRDTKGDGRKFEDYLKWLPETLKHNVNYVVFTEEKVVPHIPQKENIKIIVTPFRAIPLMYLQPKMDQILQDETYLKRIQDPQRVECKLSLYNIIQYSKFEWLKQTINYNPFNSEYFFWIDAGCSRFFEGLTDTFPNTSKLPDKFLIQGNRNTANIEITDMYKWRSDCTLVGTFFGGPKDVVLEVGQYTLDYLIKNMLCENMVNNEQIALAIVRKQFPFLFKVHIELNGTHLPILKTLA